MNAHSPTIERPPAERSGKTIIAPDMLPALPGMADTEEVKDDRPEFDWFREQEDIILECQAATAVYRNGRKHVVIRAEARDGADDDSFIFLANDEAVRALIAALQRELRGSR